MPVLKVDRLKTSFLSKEGIVTAVDGVSFAVEMGHTLGIVGESGCGKSVTALSVMKLLPEQNSFIDKDSSISVGSYEVLKMSDREMCKIRGGKIAMIFQDPMTSLNPVMTIEKQMIESFMIHTRVSRREAKTKALKMLSKVGILSPEIRSKGYPHQLSGGMRQRVMIAMALSCRPDILIADEPTTALDVTIQAQILGLIRELKNEFGMTVIIITHNMGIVAEMADEIIVMYAGQIVEYSHAKYLFVKPLHPYTRGLLDSIPRLNQKTDKLHVIKGSVPTLLNMPDGCRFSTRCPKVMERCIVEEPKLYDVDECKVKCFLYEGQIQKGGSNDE